MIRGALVFFACLIAGVGFCHADEIDERAFWQLLEKTEQALTQDLEHPILLDGLLGQWAQIDRVRIGDTSVLVDVGWIKRELASTDRSGHRRIIQYIQALLDYHNTQINSPSEGGTSAAALVAIQNDPRFQYEQEIVPTPLPTHAPPVDDAVSTPTMNASLSQLILIAFGIVVVVIVLMYAARLIGVQPAVLKLAVDAEPTNFDEAQQRAGNFETNRDYRTAIRYLYLSSLLLLDEFERDSLRHQPDEPRTSAADRWKAAARGSAATGNQCLRGRVVWLSPRGRCVLSAVPRTHRATTAVSSMSRRSIVALVILVVAFVVLTVLTAPAQPIPPLSVRSAAADGSMALAEWLRSSGYTVTEVASLSQQLDDVSLLFVLNPIVDYDAEDAARLHDWVQRGNILIIAGDPYFMNPLLEPFDVSLTYLPTTEAEAVSAAPTLLDPSFAVAQVEAVYGVDTKRADAVPHLFNRDDLMLNPLLVSLPEGQGTLWVVGALYPFTNSGLHDSGNASLIANLLANVPRRAVIGFDEAAHGFGVNDQLTLSTWFFKTAPGWGILVGFALTMIYLGLRGRRFGRPLPLPNAQPRRDTGEYIHAIAALLRRSGQRGEIAQHYDQQLRRRLSERYGVDPQLDAASLARTVHERDPRLDRAQLESVLTKLERPKVNEPELVAVSADVDHLLRSIH